MSALQPGQSPNLADVTVVEGMLTGEGRRIGIVCGRFNDLITERLLAGALDGLRRHGTVMADVTVTWVPGAFEIPFIAKRLASSGDFDAIITLGAVIRGATGHYEEVAGSASAGVARAQMDTGVPVVFGVLTVDTIEQAIERAGTKAGNKGYESAEVALEMIDLCGRLA